MSTQIQQQIQMRLKMFDDVFHNTIIALERLERFLLCDKESELEVTAVNTDRDLHNDQKNPPTLKLLYGEVQLQCSALFYQTKFDDEKLFAKTVHYFLEDLLMWYGGRPLELPFDDVDKFFIPLMSALDRQVSDVIQLTQTVKKYVCDIDNDITCFDDQKKEKAILDGFSAWVKAQDIIEKQHQAFQEKGEDVVFTEHQRGSITEGLKRLYVFFLRNYQDATPILFLDSTYKKYLEHLDFNTTPLFMEYINELKNGNMPD